MFGKSRETRKSETPEIPDLKLPENFALDNKVKPPNPLTATTPNVVTVPEKTEVSEIDSESVSNIEKISRIVSPYFIAVVGLSLYEENFFLGTILISVGILSLLKVTAKDVAVFLEWFKEFLGFSNEDDLV